MKTNDDKEYNETLFAETSEEFRNWFRSQVSTFPPREAGQWLHFECAWAAWQAVLNWKEKQ